MLILASQAVYGVVLLNTSGRSCASMLSVCGVVLLNTSGRSYSSMLPAPDSGASCGRSGRALVGCRCAWLGVRGVWAAAAANVRCRSCYL
jgi:hypothetical protein